MRSVAALLPKFKASGLRVGVLTNGPSDGVALEWVTECEWVDAMVVSGIDGVGKPSPAAFRLIVDRLGTTTANCWFIDDSADHVEAARGPRLHCRPIQG